MNVQPGPRPLVEQLRETLDFAVARIPWYHQRADVYRPPVENRADLARLPIIDRATVLADPAAFASTQEWPAAVTYSSSTTGGIGQPRWRSAAEQQALIEFISARPATSGTTLAIHPFDQGVPAVPGGVGNRVLVGMLVPWHFELIHEILTDGWASPAGRRRITTVDCFSPGLRILTEWLEQRTVDPRSFGVEHLIGYGSIQSQPWRNRLQKAWAAPYLDLYGMNDITMSEAAQCPLCHAFHFPLPVIPEVVDPVTRQPVSEGTGVLLLTELYPFAQLQVLLRYWTDDVVEIARPCPLGGFGVFLRGRHAAGATVVRPGGRPLLVGSLQVGEACAELSDVAVAPVVWAPWALDVGAPRFWLRATGPQVRVTVELRYSPGLFPDRAAAVAGSLAAKLQAAVAGLADATTDGEVSLTVDTVGPGRLVDTTTV